MTTKPLHAVVSAPPLPMLYTNTIPVPFTSNFSKGFWLEHIWIRGWHAIDQLKIEIPKDHGLHLEGDSGVGKTTILDAILWALIGDQNKVRFNRAASSSEERGRDGRNLLKYVRGHEHGVYRRTKGTSYILLEFHNAQLEEFVTIGSFIDYNGESLTSRFIIAKVPLTKALVANETNQFYEGKDLATAYERKFNDKVKVYPVATAYRGDLSRIFTGLPERFFDIVSRMAGQSEPKDLNTFTRINVFDNDPSINLDDLAKQVAGYRDSGEKLHEAEVKLVILQQIQNVFDEWETAKQEVKVYAICEAMAQIERNRQLTQGMTNDITKAETEAGELSVRLMELEVLIDKAGEEFSLATTRLDSDKRSIEILHLEELTQEETASVNSLTATCNEITRHISTLKNWMKTIPPMLAEVASDAGFELPKTILDSIQDELKAEKIERKIISDGLVDLHNWASNLKTTFDNRRHPLLERQKELRLRVNNLAEGRFNTDSRAYAIRDILRKRHGNVDLLCDLIEDVDPKWARIVETMMQSQRFALISTQENYLACRNDLIAMHNDAINVYLANPTYALRRRDVVNGTLAEKVKSNNPIARGYLNIHLNPWTACDTPEQVDAHERAVSVDGFISSGGAVHWGSVLSEGQLVFGKAAKERQREAIELELAKIETSLQKEDQNLVSVDLLFRGIKDLTYKSTNIQSEPFVQLASQRIALAENTRKLTALEAEMVDLFELQENVMRAQKKRDAMIEDKGRTATLRGHAEARQSKIRMDLTDAQQHISELEREFRELDAPENWRNAYDDLIAENGDFKLVAQSARDSKNKQESFRETRENDLARRAREYITQYVAPHSVSTDFAEQVRHCLDEYILLHDTQLDKLKEELLKLQASADMALFRKFIDRLRSELEKIRVDVRQMGKVMEKVNLGRRCYKFSVSEVLTSPTIREIFDLLGNYNTFNTQRAEDLSAKLREIAAPGLIEKLFNLFAPKDGLTSENERLRDTLLTPSRYFNFDLMASEDDGPWFDLSAHYKDGSGGEVQNPLYVVLAATMMRLYNNEDRRIRLILLDEAFSKAPGSSQNGLQMLLDMGLQPLVLTPVGRPSVEQTIGYTLHVFRDKKDYVRVSTDEVLVRMVNAVAYGLSGGKKHTQMITELETE